jgi:biofilm PGA synthesis N-glycosyltransferase PgaC
MVFLSLARKSMFFASVLIPFVIIVLYALYIRMMAVQWGKIPTHQTPSDFQPKQRIAVLIPFRDELPNLIVLAPKLLTIDYPSHLVEFIFIDDQSSDGGPALIEQYASSHKRFRLLRLETAGGKKEALQLGFEQSDSDLVVTLDADTSIHTNFLRHLACFHQLEEPVMIICPVIIRTGFHYWGELIKIEWLGIAGLTGGSAQRQKALMANGAALCVERKALDAVGGYTEHSDISSGDDMFLLVQIKKWGPNTVKYLRNEEMLVQTTGPESLRQFFAQRIRWASKSRHLKDWNMLFAGSLTILANLAICSSIVTMRFSEWHFYAFMLSFGLKSIADHSLARAVANRWKIDFKERELIVLSFIYPLYVLIIPLCSLFIKPKWKGRKIKI